MRGILWLNYFICELMSQFEYVKGKEWKTADWTEFMGKVMDGIGNKLNCHVIRKRTGNNEESGEYLNIDAFFIDRAEYNLVEKESEWDPFVLPRAVVELENYPDRQTISYCLWKILCVRAPIRVLICYQKGADKVMTLKQHLEDIIWQGSLMKGTEGDLLVIIGEESVWRETSSGQVFWDKPLWGWGEYFSVFEWRNDRLEIIEGVEW